MGLGRCYWKYEIKQSKPLSLWERKSLIQQNESRSVRISLIVGQTKVKNRKISRGGHKDKGGLQKLKSINRGGLRVTQCRVFFNDVSWCSHNFR